MRDKYSFKIAIIVSLVLHSFIFLRIPSANMKAVDDPRPRQELEMVYFEIKEKPVRRINTTPRLSQGTYSAPKKIEVKSDPVVRGERNIPQPPREVKEKPAEGKNSLSRVIMDPVSKLVPDIKLKDAKETVAYLDYFQALRERVRKAIGQPNIVDEGEVHLTFTVLSSGKLMDGNLRVLDDVSSQDSYLRNLARQGVENAVPFPPFPKSLTRPSLTFNLIISFVKR